MKQTFSTYDGFKAAVETRGLVIHVEPTGYEGMHERDPYQPAFAVLGDGSEAAPWNAFGCFQNNEDGSGFGVLFDTMDEYVEWEHSDEYDEGVMKNPNVIDDPRGRWHGRNE